MKQNICFEFDNKYENKFIDIFKYFAPGYCFLNNDPEYNAKNRHFKAYLCTYIPHLSYDLKI